MSSHAPVAIDSAAAALVSGDAAKSDKLLSVKDRMKDAALQFMEKAAGSLGADPKMAVDLVQKIFKTESATTILGTSAGRGFSRMGVRSSHCAGVGIPSSSLDRLMVSWFTMLDEDGVPVSAATRTTMQELMHSVAWDFSKSFMSFEINAGGRITVIAVSGAQYTGPVRPDPRVPASEMRLTASFTYIDGTFGLMPDLRFRQHTKSSFFSSKSWVSIENVPRGATLADFAEVLQIALLPLMLRVGVHSDRLQTWAMTTVIPKLPAGPGALEQDPAVVGAEAEAIPGPAPLAVRAQAPAP